MKSPLPTLLAIPADEIHSQFAANPRQDVKIIVPELLSAARKKFLESMGRRIKPERQMTGPFWRHSPETETNRVMTADMLPWTSGQSAGPFSMGFANERAVQVTHFHRHQTEIFYSAHPVSADYRHLNASDIQQASLPEGGALIVFPEVIHRVRLGGVTLIIGIPAVSDDKCITEL